MFVVNVVVGVMIATSFPVSTWFVPLMLVATFAFSIFAAFFATTYTAYHAGMSLLMRLNFCLFALAVCETVADALQFAPRSTIAFAAGYLALLCAAYILYAQAERRANWGAFAATLSSPTLVIENEKVKRLVKLSASNRRRGPSTVYAEIGAAIGVAAVTTVGAVFGAHGKALLQTAVAAALILSPLVFLRYMMAYFVGISEVRRVEKQRGARFDFDNLETLQRERAALLIARMLNRNLRQPARPR